MKEAIELFFEKIQHLLNLEKERQLQADKRGENYNIFEILKFEKKETCLHSAMIADLLNPNGKHALGTTPLKAFLKVIKIKELFTSTDIERAEVKTEHHIGLISDDGTEGGNIDILITIGNYVIVIENKIDASDQPTQLFRYHNFCKEKPHTLLYLTLDGHEASKLSTVSLKAGKDYFCISYKKEIKEWLNECIVGAVTKPLVRETLQQYLSVILKLTFQNMDNSTRNKLFELMTDYPEVVTEIVGTQWTYCKYLVEQYVLEPFKNWCQNEGFEWYEDSYFRNQGSCSKFGIYRPEWNKIIAVEFASSGYRDASYGIWIWKSKDPTTGLLLGSENNESWPYGWEYFDKFKAWDASLSKDFKEGKVFEYIRTKFCELIGKIDNAPDRYPMI